MGVCMHGLAVNIMGRIVDWVIFVENGEVSPER